MENSTSKLQIYAAGNRNKVEVPFAVEFVPLPENIDGMEREEVSALLDELADQAEALAEDLFDALPAATLMFFLNAVLLHLSKQQEESPSDVTNPVKSMADSIAEELKDRLN
jgi:hypothetical protein